MNTDHNVFCAFITQLANKLTKEDRAWRENSILLIDGAKYQTCPESLQHLKQLGFKVCISSPYSFAAASVEYANAFLKSVDLNPERLKTGKR